MANIAPDDMLIVAINCRISFFISVKKHNDYSPKLCCPTFCTREKTFVDFLFTLQHTQSLFKWGSALKGKGF